jgi:hypothetical protein
MGATKWCVFRPVEPTRAVVEAAVAERMKRMQTNCVDLLQVSISCRCSWFLCFLPQVIVSLERLFGQRLFDGLAAFA